MVRLSSFSIFLTIGCLTCTTATLTTSSQVENRALIVPQTATLDQFGHLYYATTQNRIIKLNEQGDSIGYYANNSFGAISLIDVTNPLKVLIYYQDFYSGVVLDRLLNETQIFSMLELGYGEIRVIGSSIDGAMWIFNDHEQRLIKATQNGQVLLRGEDLRLRFNERLTPEKIVQSGESLFLQITGRGLLVFDLFGQYKTQILQENISDFQLVGRHLMIRTDVQMILLDPMTRTEIRALPLDVNMDTKILWHNDQIIKIHANEIRRERMSPFP